MKKIILTSGQGSWGRRRLWIHRWYHQSIGTRFISPLVQHGHHIDISNQRESCFLESSHWFFFKILQYAILRWFYSSQKEFKRRRKNKKAKGKQFVNWDNVFHAGLFSFSFYLFFCFCNSKYKTTHYMWGILILQILWLHVMLMLFIVIFVIRHYPINLWFDLKRNFSIKTRNKLWMKFLIVSLSIGVWGCVCVCVVTRWSYRVLYLYCWKYSPWRMKHIEVNCVFIKEKLASKTLFAYVQSEDQFADIFTNPMERCLIVL